MNQWRCPDCEKPIKGPEFLFIGSGKELKEFLINRCGCKQSCENCRLNFGESAAETCIDCNGRNWESKEVEDKCQENINS